MRQLFKHNRVQPNPADAYPSFSPPTEEVEFMEEEAHFNMINYADQLIEKEPIRGTALKFFAATGVRPSEGLKLERRDTGDNNFIDRQRDEIVLRNHKTQRAVKARRVPLSESVLAFLDDMDAAVAAATSHKLLFPDVKVAGNGPKHLSLRQTNEAFKTGWYSVCDALNLPEYMKREITQRHFRHTFGTRVIDEATMSLEMLKSYFGHTSFSTTQKYVGAAEQMNNRTAAAIETFSWI